MDDYTRGVYILGLYARSAGLSQSVVVESYKSRYGGEVAVRSIGKSAQGIQFGLLTPLFDEIADANGQSVALSRADVNSALLKIGGQTISVAEAIVQGVEQSAKEGVSFGFASLKVIAVLALVLGAAYLVFQYKQARRVTG